MNELKRLLHGQSGASRLALALAVAIAGYLVLAGSWASTMLDTIDRLGARLPL